MFEDLFRNGPGIGKAVVRRQAGEPVCFEPLAEISSADLVRRGVVLHVEPHAGEVRLRFCLFGLCRVDACCGEDLHAKSLDFFLVR